MSKILGPLTPEQFARVEACLLNPTPGSRIEAARNYRVDLTLSAIACQAVRRYETEIAANADGLHTGGDRPDVIGTASFRNGNPSARRAILSP